MRVAIFRGAELGVRVESAPDPVPHPDQAVIRVHRCGLCGSDFHLTSGCQYDLPVGSALGHEYAGEVVALGRDCKRLRVGDRVTALPFGGCGGCRACILGDPFRCTQLQILAGGFGEYALIQERFALRLPDVLSYSEGALIEPLASAHHGVRSVRCRSDSRILVLGAGAMGLGVTLWARHVGVERIVVAARRNTGGRSALEQGATAFFTEGKNLAEKAADILQGPPDLVFDCAGAGNTLARAIELVGIGGTVAVLGASYGPVSIVPVEALQKEVHVIFSVAYQLSDFEAAMSTLTQGTTRHLSIISEEMGLQQFGDRFEALRRDRPSGKIMVDPWR